MRPPHLYLGVTVHFAKKLVRAVTDGDELLGNHSLSLLLAFPIVQSIALAFSAAAIATARGMAARSEDTRLG